MRVRIRHLEGAWERRGARGGDSGDGKRSKGGSYEGAGEEKVDWRKEVMSEKEARI